MLQHSILMCEKIKELLNPKDRKMILIEAW